ncbi:TetR/AcrR family transcriptional regulator [Mycolicibacterium mucogenicum]|uniref:TetR/AcrR family transcriptional regulator n=1 Tax=Mycolicibacterium mucogenicum TaxID=56689 RepID=UPI002269A0F3|nr:TetR/AcrR family transcriptional regulator [Mycolicibacterium mucogenicum]MCX8561004.1 TetR/AcrR family transcriptional regulator [Mycolicibacterium mucogenicum]
MTDTTLGATAVPRPRPGGRSARVVAAVHTATLELLAETGYESLQLSDVAKRAQVNKTTVYRRWPTKAALVADLLVSFTKSNVATPDTGSLQADLEQLLGDIVSALAGRAIRAVLNGALTGADDSDDVRIARDGFWAERFRRSGAVVERAIARGEIPPGTDPRAVLEMAASPVYFRVLFTADAITPDYVGEIVRRTIRAFA